jgi:hypothetical protein
LSNENDNGCRVYEEGADSKPIVLRVISITI